MAESWIETNLNVSKGMVSILTNREATIHLKTNRVKAPDSPSWPPPMTSLEFLNPLYVISPSVTQQEAQT